MLLDTPAPAVHLSPRQHQIVGLLAEGKSDKEIASALQLSPATVRTYLQRLYRRYGLQGRTHAVAVTFGAIYARGRQIHDEEPVMFDGAVTFDDNAYPPTVAPSAAGLDPAAWAGRHRADIDELLHVHGAVLLRGFGVTDVAGFEQVARALVDTLYGEYGDLPHEKDADVVYRSTPYPAEQSILFHHESSHMPQWPTRQFFCCLQPSAGGGATPLVDSRQVYSELPPRVRDRFERAGICYIRNFVEGLDVDWRQMFGTDDRSEVERRCREQGVECEWLDDGTLRTRQRAPAVVRHPVTGEPVFFNQLLLHHPACLEDFTRDALTALFGDDEAAFPRCATYGDGGLIDAETVHQVQAIHDRLARRFSWQQGDIVVVDNMLVSHGRDPFTGSRKVVVAMGDMAQRRAFEAAAASGN